MKLDYVNIGKRLQEIRKSSNLTQQALADRMGVSVSYVKNTESGKKPSLEYLSTVTNICHTSFDYLLTGAHPQRLFGQQKNEVVFDPDTKEMLDIVKFMMSYADPEIRVWAKVQFRKTFAEYYEALKKEHA